jgi:hypothetical protein
LLLPLLCSYNCNLCWAHTCTNVADQVLHLLVAEQLGEQAGPVGLNCDACCLHNSVDVVSLWAKTHQGKPEPA